MCFLYSYGENEGTFAWCDAEIINEMAIGTDYAQIIIIVAYFRYIHIIN